MDNKDTQHKNTSNDRYEKQDRSIENDQLELKRGYISSYNQKSDKSSQKLNSGQGMAERLTVSKGTPFKTPKARLRLPGWKELYKNQEVNNKKYSKMEISQNHQRMRTICLNKEDTVTLTDHQKTLPSLKTAISHKQMMILTRLVISLSV